MEELRVFLFPVKEIYFIPCFMFQVSLADNLHALSDGGIHITAYEQKVTCSV